MVNTTSSCRFEKLLWLAAGPIHCTAPQLAPVHVVHCTIRYTAVCQVHCIVCNALIKCTVLCAMHSSSALYRVQCTHQVHCIVCNALIKCTVSCAMHSSSALYRVQCTHQVHCIVCNALIKCTEKATAPSYHMYVPSA